jgi:hypothetical protein
MLDGLLQVSLGHAVRGPDRPSVVVFIGFLLGAEGGDLNPHVREDGEF